MMVNHPTTKPAVVARDRNGYAARVLCHHVHSGNRRLYPADRQGRFWECCGCGYTIGSHDVAAKQRGEDA